MSSSRAKGLMTWQFALEISNIISTVGQSPWEANCCLSTSHFPEWNCKVHYHGHMSRLTYSCPETYQSSLHPSSFLLNIVIILSFHLRLGLTSSLFPSAFRTGTLYAPFLSPICATFLTHFIVSLLVTLITSGVGPGSSVGIVTELPAGWSGDQIPVGTRFSALQTGPGAHPASCTMGTESFPGVKCGRGVLLTTHPPSSAAVMED